MLVNFQLQLGNLDSKRDWGHARDYCEVKSDKRVLYFIFVKISLYLYCKGKWNNFIFIILLIINKMYVINWMKNIKFTKEGYQYLWIRIQEDSRCFSLDLKWSIERGLFKNQILDTVYRRMHITWVVMHLAQKYYTIILRTRYLQLMLRREHHFHRKRRTIGLAVCESKALPSLLKLF